MNVHHRLIPESRISGRRLGRHVEHDARSRAFGVVLQQKPLVSVTWERHCDPFDQGDLGSCTGNAMAGALMTGPLYQDGRVLDESNAVAIYEAATHLDNIPGAYPPDDTGSSGLAAAKAAKKMGLLSVYHHAFGLAAALHGLAAGPIIIGINWWASFDTPQGDNAELVGQWDSQSGDYIRGGHELVLDALDVENGYVIGTNSWGLSWGAKGKFCMTFGTFQALLQQQGDVIVPVR